MKNPKTNQKQMLQSTLYAILTTRFISILMKYLATATTADNYESKKTLLIEKNLTTEKPGWSIATSLFV